MDDEVVKGELVKWAAHFVREVLSDGVGATASC